MTFGEIIAHRRDGLVQSADELRLVAQGAANGSVPDYQLAAWLMAATLNPLTLDETADLTLAMAASGETLDLSALPRPWVDKHSTGGVGDKTTLVVLPILAACGVTVVKMSGRGLGVTGGTVDKLAAIPGFRLDLSPDELVAQASRIGIALTGQTPDLAPADKALYALRDATGTVASMPLIVSSILSKKIAGGAECVVLDVKCGSGAFMKSVEEARELARWLEAVGTRAGLRIRALITDMSQPLGSAVGNSLEAGEALSVLGGKPLAPNVERFRTLCVRLAGLALWTAGVSADWNSGTERAERALQSGHAMAKATEWFQAQGALPGWVLPTAPFKTEVIHQGPPGWVHEVQAEAIGLAAIALGAGRQTKEDTIDPSVGIEVRIMVGERVETGEVLAVVHSRDGMEPPVAEAFRISPEEAETPALFL
ncbi:MAG: thymidine phosphorylase [Fimbriimonas sp.]